MSKAKTKAKAKKPSKRRVIVAIWIVRDENGDYHAIVSHDKPTKRDDGEWWDEKRVFNRGMAPAWDPVWGLDLCSKDYEVGTPKSLHLKPGGGPIKVKLVEA